jgi:hypothetical protein
VEVQGGQFGVVHQAAASRVGSPARVRPATAA